MLWTWFRRLSGRLEAPRPPLPVVVYSREGCHLCDEALALLRKHERKYRLQIEVHDIDQDPELSAAYGGQVPVVKLDGRVRFHGRVDEVLLRRLLAAHRQK